MKEEILKAVKSGNLKKAFRLVEDNLMPILDSEQQNDWTALQARFNKNEKDHSKGIKDDKEYNTEHTKITATFIDMVSELSDTSSKNENKSPDENKTIKTPNAMRQDIFISYSHHEEDKPYFDEIKRQLASLKSYGLEVHIWDDTQIRTGDDWLHEIKTALAKTKVGVLLVSPNFLASRFIGEKEVPALLEKVQTNGGKIMSVILRKTLFSMHPLLSKYQSANDPKKPLNSLTEPEKDDVYTKLLEDILHFYKDKKE